MTKTGEITLTAAMDEARTIDQMADAFHPAELSGRPYHRYSVLDLVEAALLFGAGRASAEDFRQAARDCFILTDAIGDEVRSHQK